MDVNSELYQEFLKFVNIIKYGSENPNYKVIITNPPQTFIKFTSSPDKFKKSFLISRNEIRDIVTLVAEELGGSSYNTREELLNSAEVESIDLDKPFYFTFGFES